MKIERDQEFEAELIQRIHDREFHERTGVHCSDLIYCLNKQVLRRVMTLAPDRHEILLFSLGWSTQRWLTGKDEDQPPIEKDGIIVTQDAIYKGSPWELKATFQSSAKPVQDNKAWLRQIMAQCYVTGNRTARLSRLELAGNWKSFFGKAAEKDLPENRKPDLHAFQLTFEPEELEDNWFWLLARASNFRYLIERNAVGKEPDLYVPEMALPDDNTWECEYCRPEYFKLCYGGEEEDG